MSLEDQARRRDAMIDAVESEGRGVRLATVVRDLYESGQAEIDVLYGDLEQIQPLLSEEGQDHVIDVMDLLVGICRPEERIGPYAWGDERNIFWRRHQADVPYAGPDVE